LSTGQSSALDDRVLDARLEIGALFHVSQQLAVAHGLARRALRRRAHWERGHFFE